MVDGAEAVVFARVLVPSPKETLSANVSHTDTYRRARGERGLLGGGLFSRRPVARWSITLSSIGRRARPGPVPHISVFDLRSTSFFSLLFFCLSFPSGNRILPPNFRQRRRISDRTEILADVLLPHLRSQVSFLHRFSVEYFRARKKMKERTIDRDAQKVPALSFKTARALLFSMTASVRS